MLLLSQAVEAKKIKLFNIRMIAVLSAVFFTSSAYSSSVRNTSILSDLGVQDALSESNRLLSKENLFEPIDFGPAIDDVMNDPDHKIGSQFKIPEIIRPSVKFWMKVYTQYSTKNIVIFDSNNLDVVYDVIDLRPLSVSSRNLVVYEILSERKIKRTMEAFRKAFASLAKNPNPKKPNREEAIILSKVTPTFGKRDFKSLSASMKFIRGQRDNILHGLVAAESFFPKMERIFKELNVPTELTRLSLVESSFNLKATSKVGASGVWQFMPSIGRKFLIMDDARDIDERRSPLKSTIAAAKLLHWNYKYLGSWILAVISYNHGLKNLPHLKPEQSNFSQVVHLFHNGVTKSPLGWASRSYYTSFLAVLYAETYRDLFYGKLTGVNKRPIMFAQLPKEQSAKSYMKEKKLSLEEFRYFNADVQDHQKALPKGFVVIVPTQPQIKENELSANFDHFVHLTLKKIKRLSKSPAKAFAKAPTKEPRATDKKLAQAKAKVKVSKALGKTHAKAPSRKGRNTERQA